MCRSTYLSLSLTLVLAATGAVSAQGPRVFGTALSPTQEVPALSSPASGFATIEADDATGTLTYRLAYDGLTGEVRQAHVHMAQAGVNGGIVLWLCGTAANPGPVGTPVCPASGEVSGVLGPDQVVGPAGQGIAPGELAEAIQAMRNGVAYVNVHSSAFPGGEVRGQLKPGRR